MRLPRLPSLESQDFPEALSTWLKKTGWSQRQLAELIGIDRKQIQRWTTSAARQSPSGRAADLYRQLQAGTLARELRQEKSRIDSRLDLLKKISWEGD